MWAMIAWQGLAPGPENQTERVGFFEGVWSEFFSLAYLVLRRLTPRSPTYRQEIMQNATVEGQFAINAMNLTSPLNIILAKIRPNKHQLAEQKRIIDKILLTISDLQTINGESRKSQARYADQLTQSCLAYSARAACRGASPTQFTQPIPYAYHL